MRTPIFTKVDTANGEPELWRDENGFARWADQSYVTDKDVERFEGDGDDGLAEAVRRNILLIQPSGPN